MTTGRINQVTLIRVFSSSSPSFPQPCGGVPEKKKRKKKPRTSTVHPTCRIASTSQAFVEAFRTQFYQTDFIFPWSTCVNQFPRLSPWFPVVLFNSSLRLDTIIESQQTNLQSPEVWPSDLQVFVCRPNNQPIQNMSRSCRLFVNNHSNNFTCWNDCPNGPTIRFQFLEYVCPSGTTLTDRPLSLPSSITAYW